MYLSQDRGWCRQTLAGVFSLLWEVPRLEEQRLFVCEPLNSESLSDRVSQSIRPHILDNFENFATILELVLVIITFYFSKMTKMSKD